MRLLWSCWPLPLSNRQICLEPYTCTGWQVMAQVLSSSRPKAWRGAAPACLLTPPLTGPGQSHRHLQARHPVPRGRRCHQQRVCCCWVRRRAVVLRPRHRGSVPLQPEHPSLCQQQGISLIAAAAAVQRPAVSCCKGRAGLQASDQRQLRPVCCSLELCSIIIIIADQSDMRTSGFLADDTLP